MSTENDKRAMQLALGDEASRGIELAVTPVLFGGAGWLLDGWLGTGPWLAIGLGAFAVLGVVLRMWFAYDADMRRHESTGRWARRSAEAAAETPDVDEDLWSRRRPGTSGTASA